MKKYMKKNYGKITMLTLCLMVLIGSIVLCSVLPLRQAEAADIAKSQGELMDWTLLDDIGAVPFLESAILDDGEGYDTSIGTVLYVTMVNIGAAADAGSVGFKVFVRVSATDEGWREFIDLGATITASNVGDLDDTAASAQAVIPLTSTTNFETPGDVFFLHDAGTIADSALVIFGGTYDDDVSITVIDNLVNAYDASDNLYDNINQWPIRLPGGCDEAKVLFYNGDADANYACRIDYANEDTIE